MNFYPFSLTLDQEIIRPNKQMQFVTFLISLLSFAAAETSGVFSTNCSTPTDIYTVNTLSVGPNPVIAGQTLNVNITGHLNQPILEGAYIQIKVKLGVIPGNAPP